MERSKIKAFARECGFEEIQYLMDWNGWKVYIPCFEDLYKVGPDIGRPFYILVKDDEIRGTPYIEFQEILKEAEARGLYLDSQIQLINRLRLRITHVLKVKACQNRKSYQQSGTSNPLACINRALP